MTANIPHGKEPAGVSGEGTTRPDPSPPVRRCLECDAPIQRKPRSPRVYCEEHGNPASYMRRWLEKHPTYRAEHNVARWVADRPPGGRGRPRTTIPPLADPRADASPVAGNPEHVRRTQSMTAPLDPRLVAFDRICRAAIRAAFAQDVAWWAPGDGQSVDVRLEDGWVIADIGGHELLRMPTGTLERIAYNIQLDRN